MKMKRRRAVVHSCPVWCAAGLDSQVVEEYNRREQEIQNLEKELDDKTNALTTYRRNIAEVRPTSHKHPHHADRWRVTKRIDVFPRRKSAGWILWSCWWIRSTSASVISSARCSALERWICTPRMRWDSFSCSLQQHHHHWLIPPTNTRSCETSFCPADSEGCYFVLL